MATIQEFLATRNITSLLHFTQVDNLDSILDVGLMTPGMCELLDIKTKTNDAVRHDGQDAICLSIEFPNYQLYWSFQNRDVNVQWVIIELIIDVLWVKRCCFCTNNAASNEVSAQTFESRQGLPALRALFDDYDNKKRAELNVPDYYTTNPQAEVLCIDSISPEFIKALYFNRLDPWNQYKLSHPELNVKWGTFFKYRRDWNNWK